jgi:hypothetical protein
LRALACELARVDKLAHLARANWDATPRTPCEAVTSTAAGPLPSTAGAAPPVDAARLLQTPSVLPVFRSARPALMTLGTAAVLALSATIAATHCELALSVGTLRGGLQLALYAIFLGAAAAALWVLVARVLFCTVRWWRPEAGAAATVARSGGGLLAAHQSTAPGMAATVGAAPPSRTSSSPSHDVSCARLGVRVGKGD